METTGETKGANPQAEDGHIDISNEIGEALARTQISGNEWRVLWVIFRKTYGWHKKMDCISTTQFQKATGLQRRHVSRTLSNLIERHIITKNGDSFITSYGLQKDYTKWKSITKNGDKKQTVTKIVPKPSPKLVHTKETTKEKTLVGHRKKETDPRVKDFLNFWGETYLQETGGPYVFAYGKEGDLVKDLLKVHSLETLEAMVKAFFQDEEAKRRGFDIGTFKFMINRLGSRKAMDPLEQARREIARRE